jgi:hypothetical protein
MVVALPCLNRRKALRKQNRQWVDARTKPPPKSNGQLTLNVVSANNRDVMWLADRTSSRR